MFASPPPERAHLHANRVFRKVPPSEKARLRHYLLLTANNHPITARTTGRIMMAIPDLFYIIRFSVVASKKWALFKFSGRTSSSPTFIFLCASTFAMNDSSPIRR